MCVTSKFTISMVLFFSFFTCADFCDVVSYDVAVRDVSAGRLTGSDDLHHLTSSEAIVPCNGIRNLYSWKLFGRERLYT
jgi:hypothetical protein